MMIIKKLKRHQFEAIFIIWFLLISKKTIEYYTAKYAKDELIVPSKDDIRELTPIPSDPHVRFFYLFQYIKMPSNCIKFDKFSHVVILVKSRADKPMNRHIIRNTWGHKTFKINVRFMIGFKNESYQFLIDQEAQEFQDIVQMNFIEHYYNNTLKTFMTYDYATYYCPEATFFLFIDDDYVLDTARFLTYLSHKVYATSSLFAPVIFEGYVRNNFVERNKKERYFIPKKTYKFKYWPPYPAGGAYFSSYMAIAKVMFYFPSIRYIWMDDAVIGLALKLAGIELVDNIFFHYHGPFKDLAFIYHSDQNIKNMVYRWKLNTKDPIYKNWDTH